MSIGARHPRIHDAAHLAYVRTQRCCIGYCNRPAEAAHIRMACEAVGKRPTGMGEKPDDRWTTPLCAYHHRTGIDSQHNSNEAAWWAMRGLDPFAIAARLWRESGGEARAAVPKPIKQRKIAARPPRDQRKKIQSGRPLQSNPVIRSRGFERGRV